MEIKITTNKIELNKELNELDKLAIEFSLILNNLNIKYTIISGYVAIVFGRSRTSEDIDVIIEKLDFEKFKKLWDHLYAKFECINTEDVKEAYEDYLLEGTAIRFARKGRFVPNMELKFAKTELDFWGLKNKKELILNSSKILISPIELQIPFKLFLGTEKDFEDARHLYKLFKGKIDLKLLHEFNKKLKIVEKFSKYIE